MKALALLLAAAIAGSAAAAQPSPALERERLARGEFGYRSRQADAVLLYRYEIYRAPDSLVTVEIAAAEMPLGAGFSPATERVLPRVEDKPFVLPLSALRLLMSNIDRYDGVPADPVSEQLEVGIGEDGQVVFGMRRSVEGSLALLLALLVAAVGVAGVFYARSKRERQARLVLLEAQRAAVASREAERLRIARELHDGPVQQLHGIQLRIHAIPGTSDGQASSYVAAGELQEVVNEVRAIAEDLRPPALGPFGIAAALQTLAARVGEQHPHVTVIADISEGGPEPEGDVPLALFRIAQEAVSNAVQHANPDIVILRYRPSPLHLEVTDDGSGFALPPDLGVLRRNGHFGVVGIAERVALIGGRMSVVSGPGGGTRLSVKR